ncbi:MAG TPA: BsuPI-related putative proteinase inhibitor [Gemmatimonadales bacterium]
MRRTALGAVALQATLLGGVAECQTTPPPERQADSMRVELLVPPSVGVGQPVPMTLRIRNTKDQPITLYLQGRPVAFDLIVEQPDGEVVWRRLEGSAVSAILGVRTLAPGAVLELKDSWRQQTRSGRRVSPGQYSVSGWVLTDREPIRAGPVPLRIE